MERLPVDVTSIRDRTMNALLESESSAVALQQEREILSAVCIYPHVSRTTGPRALTDYVIPPFRWHAHSASGLHSLSTSVSFLFCALLLANDDSLDSPVVPSTWPTAWNESILCLFVEAELSLGGLQRVCVLVFFRSSPVSQAGRRQPDVPQPKPTRTERSLISRVAQHFGLIEVRVVSVDYFRSLLEFFSNYWFNKAWLSALQGVSAVIICVHFLFVLLFQLEDHKKLKV